MSWLLSIPVPPADQQGPTPAEGTVQRAKRIANLLLGFDRDSLPVDDTIPLQGSGWIAPLSLTTASGLMLVAWAQIAGMDGNTFAHGLYWIGIIAIVFPAVVRLTWPRVSRQERLVLTLIAGLGLYGVKILHSPLHFSQFDEFLHWATALNIMEDKRLFSTNSLLPISPLYPGLEIVTTALSNLSGLSLVTCGILVIGVSRAVFLTTLFLIAEAVSGSSRVAGLACAIFMSTSTFAMFQAQFAYESFAFAFMALSVLAAIRLMNENQRSGLHLAACIVFPAALAVTHHITSYFGTCVLAGFAVLTLLRDGLSRQGLLVGIAAAIALIIDVAWYGFTGGSGSSYLGPTLEAGIEEFFAFISSPAGGRTPFVGEDSVQQAMWQKLTAMASVALLCAGLATGFFRSLNLAGGRIGLLRKGVKVTWDNNGLVLITLLTLAFPFSILFRFTRSGWEIGDRLGSYTSLGTCIVAAIAVAGLWLGSSPGRLRANLVASLLGIMLLGGVILGWGPNAINYPYKVSAGAQSIEPLGISAAQWTNRWLGPGQRFITDTSNRVLLATFGRQIPITSLEGGIDTASVIVAEVLGADELNAIKETMADYVMIDLRLTTALPVFRSYFEAGEATEIHSTPPEPAALLKFGRLKGVSRPFDNGVTMIFDVRPLRALRLPR